MISLGNLSKEYVTIPLVSISCRRRHSLCNAEKDTNFDKEVEGCKKKGKEEINSEEVRKKGKEEISRKK